MFQNDAERKWVPGCEIVRRGSGRMKLTAQGTGAAWARRADQFAT